MESKLCIATQGLGERSGARMTQRSERSGCRPFRKTRDRRAWLRTSCLSSGIWAFAYNH